MVRHRIAAKSCASTPTASCDGKNDGPFKAEPNENKDEADVIWAFDMMAQMGISQHNMCSCSVGCVGDTLFVCTSNGVDVDHLNIPAPTAPSFFAMDRNTAKVLWTDNSPGMNILHGQWSSPAYGVFGGQPQVLFGGGDGWLYSFDPAGDGQGHCQAVVEVRLQSERRASTRSTAAPPATTSSPLRSSTTAWSTVPSAKTPSTGRVTATCGASIRTSAATSAPSWPSTRTARSSPPRRIQDVITSAGEKAVANPNSAAVWHFDKKDFNGDGQIEFEEEMHRTIGTAAIKDGLLYIADFSGLFHCLDAKTGERYWVHDMFSESWGSPLIVEGKVYIGDADGDVTVFEVERRKKILSEVNVGNAVYTSPVVANNVLYIANRSTLFAIGGGGK